MEVLLEPRAQQVLDAWFGAPGSAEFGTERKVWFKKNRAFDAALSGRFGALLEDAQAGKLAHWADTPLGALALIDARPVFAQLLSRHTARVRGRCSSARTSESAGRFGR
jgi:uncharacterized protein (DUF924 family)